MDLAHNSFTIEKLNRECLKPIVYSALEKFSIKNASILFDTDSSIPHHKYDSIYHIISYKKNEIGHLYIDTKSISSGYSPQTLSDILRKVNLVVNRYITHSISTNFLGNVEELIGASDHIIKIEDFIEKSSNSDYPVMIKGQSGSEALAVASAIHYDSNRNKQEFREINCSTIDVISLNEALLSAEKEINNGTLYLSEIENLDKKQQNILINFLCKNRLTNISSSPRNRIRYIASSNKDLVAEVQKKEFSNRLFNDFNFLTVEIPSLKKRKEDIPHMINYLLSKNQADTAKSFSEEAITTLSLYEWPENYKEFERVIIKLIILSDSESITNLDIMRSTPEIISNSYLYRDNTDLIEHLSSDDYQSQSFYHKGLQRSLNYISKNFNKNISLSTLASEACVSPSHLSYLFRYHLGKSFKEIVTELRIKKIKEDFQKNPRKKITEASLEVGFGDLSHFEKMFKRYAGMTPREYKKNLQRPY